jgi:hypothetical protein
MDLVDSITRPILERFNREEWPVIFWFYVKTLGLFHSGKYQFMEGCIVDKHWLCDGYFANHFVLTANQSLVGILKNNSLPHKVSYY